MRNATWITREKIRLKLHLISTCKLTPIININPFHAFHGPCPGILIQITMPIPDRVRASLQLIHYMLNSHQVWSDASSVLQNIITVPSGDCLTGTDRCYTLVRPCMGILLG